MANCLVTVSGTTGSVIVNYIDSGSVARTLTSGPGSFLIADTGTDYTWSNVSGDAALSSGCITFTEVEVKCYIVSWEILVPAYSAGMTVDSILIGTDTYNIDDTPYPFTSPKDLGNIVNSLEEPNITATAYKITKSASKAEFFLVLRVLGEDIPYIKIKNVGDSHHLYLKGIFTADCSPAGYTEF